MTEIQVIHHQEQMQASRKEFLELWYQCHPDYNRDTPLRTDLAIMHKDWEKWKQDHPLK